MSSLSDHILGISIFTDLLRPQLPKGNKVCLSDAALLKLSRNGYNGQIPSLYFIRCHLRKGGWLRNNIVGPDQTPRIMPTIVVALTHLHITFTIHSIKNVWKQLCLWWHGLLLRKASFRRWRNIYLCLRKPALLTFYMSLMWVSLKCPSQHRTWQSQLVKRCLSVNTSCLRLYFFIYFLITTKYIFCMLYCSENCLLCSLCLLHCLHDTSF